MWLHSWREGVGGLLRERRRVQRSGASLRPEGSLCRSSRICLFQRLSQVTKASEVLIETKSAATPLCFCLKTHHCLNVYACRPCYSSSVTLSCNFCFLFYLFFLIRMVTVSKDGTWKLWNTNVEYKKQQDPYLLKTVPCVSSEGSLAALSPDGRVVAISDGCNLAMYNAASGELEEEMHGVHSGPINDLRFDVNGRFLVCSGDKAIRVFHNAPGYRAAIRDMQDMLKKAQNEAMKQRLQQQINDAQSALDTVLAAPLDWRTLNKPHSETFWIGLLILFFVIILIFLQPQFLLICSGNEGMCMQFW